MYSILGDTIHVVIVADGVSTCDDDHMASSTCIQVIDQVLSNPQSSTIEAYIKDAITHANKILFGGLDKGLVLKTTLSIVAYSEQEKSLYWCNVGDSRIQEKRNSLLQSISKDDSVKQHVRNADGSMKMQAGMPVYRYFITRCIGADPHETMEIHKMPITESTFLILSSDGFYELLEFHDYVDILKNTADLAVESDRVEKMCKGQIRDDASFGILSIRLHRELTINQLEDSLVSVEEFRSNVFSRFQNAISNYDHQTCKRLLELMNERNVYLSKAELLSLLDNAVKAKLNIANQIALVARRL